MTFRSSTLFKRFYTIEWKVLSKVFFQWKDQKWFNTYIKESLSKERLSRTTGPKGDPFKSSSDDAWVESSSFSAVADGHWLWAHIPSDNDLDIWRLDYSLAKYTLKVWPVVIASVLTVLIIAFPYDVLLFICAVDTTERTSNLALIALMALPISYHSIQHQLTN